MSEETLKASNAVREAENYLQENYPIEPGNVESVLNMLRNYEEPGFPGRKDIVVSVWAVKAEEMANQGYDYRFGANPNKPDSDLATLMAALVKFDNECLPGEYGELDWMMWKIKIMTEAELTNARNYVGSPNADLEEAPVFIEKADKLYGLYQKLSMASEPER